MAQTPSQKRKKKERKTTTTKKTFLPILRRARRTGNSSLSSGRCPVLRRSLATPPRASWDHVVPTAGTPAATDRAAPGAEGSPRRCPRRLWTVGRDAAGPTFTRACCWGPRPAPTSRSSVRGARLGERRARAIQRTR